MASRGVQRHRACSYQKDLIRWAAGKIGLNQMKRFSAENLRQYKAETEEFRARNRTLLLKELASITGILVGGFALGFLALSAMRRKATS